MGHSKTNLRYHLVFATKHRRAIITIDLEQILIPMLESICCDLGVHVVKIGCADDHVHMAVGIPPTSAISDVVKHIKGRSSYELRLLGGSFASFAWQEGYYAATVNPKQIEFLIQYISAQRTRHGY